MQGAATYLVSLLHTHSLPIPQDRHASTRGDPQGSRHIRRIQIDQYSKENKRKIMHSCFHEELDSYLRLKLILRLNR